MKLWFFYFFAFFAIILIRYFLIAGGTYWLFYSFFGGFFGKQYSDFQSPNRDLIKNDIELSIISTFVFSVCTALVMYIHDSGATRLYSSIDDYGLFYLVISFLGVIFLQDTCFYFFHRVFHHPKLFRWLHRGHHRSNYPTPWTSFALDFFEALIQGLFLIAVVFIIPVHFIVLGLLLTTMTIWAVVNHLGFELFPAFPNHWLGKWLISATYHSIHHRNYQIHYGLYFTFWDRLLGTNDLKDEHQ
ncbi:MAG: sterol desaturase family protein [Limnoraphis sp. WC205]|jgi:sterol desaturase/sphingolipid hydroxylase (fatty acid hydroxylase superfamily)|nr:sterol desaturase family protein [Limnoraphis sp. WC205]